MSRSTQDSGHITDLKAEIGLLKNFIMESRSNLAELKYAEQVTFTEERFDSANVVAIYPEARNSDHDSHRVESPIGRPTSPELSVSASDDDTAYSEDENQEPQSSTNFMSKADEISKPGAMATNYSSRPNSIHRGPSDVNIHRESNTLLQIIPYRPQADPTAMSNRLLTNGQPSNSVRTTAKLEATYSVRLLLDKWTTSGSAPIENLLEEDVKVEA